METDLSEDVKKQTVTGKHNEKQGKAYTNTYVRPSKGVAKGKLTKALLTLFHLFFCLLKYNRHGSYE